MLRNYLLTAWKVLRRRPFFTFVSLFGIAFTLAVLLVASAIADHAFGPGGPEVDRHRSLVVDHLVMRGERYSRSGDPGYAFLDRHLRDLPGVERASFFSQVTGVASYQTGSKHELWMKRTDADYWRILDFDFLEGGPFGAAAAEAGRAVAVINAATRDRLFAGRPALGRRVEIDDLSFEVVGVVEDVSFLRRIPFADVWVPLASSASSSWRHDVFGELNALLLATSRDRFAEIRVELAARVAAAEPPDPTRYDRFVCFALTPLEIASRELFETDDEAPPSALRLGAAAAAAILLFMLLPSVNLVNVNVSRVLERTSEIGVRRAFGASSRDLVGQFLVENLVLTACGATVALATAAAALAGLGASGWIPYADFTLNLRIFAYGFGLLLAFALLSGIYPAWRMSRLDPARALAGRTP